METNYQIKKKELFKESQRLIKICGNLKKVQSDLIASLNKCAILECGKANQLKKSIAMIEFKQCLKSYFRVYGDKMICEEQIEKLRNWTAKEPVDYEKSLTKKKQFDLSKLSEKELSKLCVASLWVLLYCAIKDYESKSK